MPNNISLPTYQKPTVTPMVGNVARITAVQKSYIPTLLDVTQSPNVSALFRLLITDAHDQLTDHAHHAFYSVSELRPFSVSYKLTGTQQKYLFQLRDTYRARSCSDVVCYLLDKAIQSLNVKDGE